RSPPSGPSAHFVVRPLTPSVASPRVVEHEPERMAPAGAHHAEAVAHGHRRPAARGAHGPLARGEDERAALREHERGRARLRARALLDEDELAAREVLAWPIEGDDDLEREDELAV